MTQSKVQKRPNIKVGENSDKAILQKLLLKLGEMDDFWQDKLSEMSNAMMRMSDTMAEMNDKLVQQESTINRLVDKDNCLRETPGVYKDVGQQKAGMVTIPEPMPTWERTIEHPVQTRTDKNGVVEHRRAQFSADLFKQLMKDELVKSRPDSPLPGDDVIAATVDDVPQLSKTVVDQLRATFDIPIGTAWGKLRGNVKRFGYRLLEGNAPSEIPLGKCRRNWGARLLISREFQRGREYLRRQAVATAVEASSGKSC